MQIATILPTPHLDEIANDTYHMCLYQEMISNPEYAKFYQDRIAEGKFVIMDNGAAEGVNPTIEELIPVWEQYKPREVVLPDVVGNYDETLAKFEQSYSLMAEKGLLGKYHIMAVPQGETFTAWIDCMKEMVRRRYVTTIGVSKFTTKLYQKVLGKETNVRLECVDHILAETENSSRPPIEIHLLGCHNHPTEIGQIANIFPSVRGTDSAIAYVYTRKNRELTRDRRRPDNKHIDFKKGTVDNIQLLRDNIDRWKTFCTE